jgi:hypothetical protein
VVDEGERVLEVDRLLNELSEATARKAALLSEAQDFAARLPEIRQAFGNPFFYSHPEEPDESFAHYTGWSSHEVFTPTFRALRRVDRELGRINARLLELGVNTA